MPPRCQLLSGSIHTPRLFTPSPQSTHRTFTTSPALYKNPLARRRGGDLGSHLPKHVIPKDAQIPEYPYGPNLLFKQSNKGLYGGQMIQFGNNVSPETETKTRRNWKPNVLSKSLYSVALKKRIKLRVTSKVLKTIDREGGLDEYLLRDGERRIKELGPTGWALRWTLMQTPIIIARFRAEAAAIGLAQDIIDQRWPNPKTVANRKTKEKAKRRERRKKAEAKISKIRQQETAAKDAKVEYRMARRAAKRYLYRGLVETEREGIKLAFIRADKRKAAREALAKAAGGIKAYRSMRQARIAQAQALKEAAQKRKDERAAKIEAVGGESAWRAKARADVMKEIEEAEQARQERQDLEAAFWKAQKAIEAEEDGGAEAYVRSVVGSTIDKNAKREEAGQDAWGALMSATNARPGRQLNA